MAASTAAAPGAPRIGLLGGSFDPPHRAHLALGRAAREQLGLDELRWLPAGAPWQKSARKLAPAAHRLAMLGLLVDGEPGNVVDARELRRDGPTFTIETVRELQAERPGAQWFLVIGQDQYWRFDSWRDWPELLQRLTLAVAGRAGEAPLAGPALAAAPHRFCTLAMPRLDISASDIRQRLAGGQDVAALVGDRVAGYIDQNSLYQEANTEANRH